MAASGGGLVPVWRDVPLDTDTPAAAFAKPRRRPFAFLLESAPAGGETWARYTFLGTEPRRAWRLTGGAAEERSPAIGRGRPAGGRTGAAATAAVITATTGTAAVAPTTTAAAQ